MFDCTSYPSSNLGDFSGFGDYFNPGGVPVWQQLGFDDKGTWKRAGRPTEGAIVTVGGTVAPSPIVGSTGSAGSAGSAGSSGAAGTSGSDGSEGSSGGGSLLSGIPSSYLMIGAVVVLLMVLKK